jgi:hypothetical protein
VVRVFGSPRRSVNVSFRYISPSRQQTSANSQKYVKEFQENKGTPYTNVSESRHIPSFHQVKRSSINPTEYRELHSIPSLGNQDLIPKTPNILKKKNRENKLEKCKSATRLPNLGIEEGREKREKWITTGSFT